MNAGLRSHGQVLTLLFDRATPGRLLAGLNAWQSLSASEDDGSSWLPLPAEASPSVAPWSPPTYVLWQPVRAPQVILAGTGDGLYRSENGGRSWSAVKLPSGTQPVYALAEDRGGTLYMGAGGARVLSSTDEGRQWEELTTLPTGSAILSVAVSPAADWLLAGTDGAGLFSSRDRGLSWQRVEPVGDTFVSSILLQPEGQLPCHGAITCVIARTRGGMFATLDGGETWAKVDPGWDGRVDALTVAGAEPAWLLATDRGVLYRSLDGVRWESWGEGLGRRGAVFRLAADPRRPDHVFAATENGLYVSTDGGVHWQPSLDGPGDPSADALALGSDGMLYLANLDGVYASPDAGVTWEHWGQGLPPVPMLSVAVAPSAPNVIYAGSTGAGLYRSDDRGITWSVTAWDGASVPGIAIHPTDSDLVYFRVAFERVYSSADGGKSVQARWTGFTLFTEVMSLVVDSREPDRLFAGGTDTLYRSLDGAASWQPVGPELDGQTVFAIVAHYVGPSPRSPASVLAESATPALLAGATKGVYASDDAGQSWRPLGEGLEDITVTALAINPASRERVYAGTKYRGVFRSGDGGQTWEPAGLDGLSVATLLASEDGRWLYAATPQGFYRAEAK
jgi:photosystem II stability/assembly factor-like uncharacterized protein